VFNYGNGKAGAVSIRDHLEPRKTHTTYLDPIGNGQEEQEEETSGSPKHRRLGKPFVVAFAKETVKMVSARHQVFQRM
jgi:hypothetical protein